MDKERVAGGFKNFVNQEHISVLPVPKNLGKKMLI